MGRGKGGLRRVGEGSGRVGGGWGVLTDSDAESPLSRSLLNPNSDCGVRDMTQSRRRTALAGRGPAGGGGVAGCWLGAGARRVPAADVPGEPACQEHDSD